MAWSVRLLDLVLVFNSITDNPNIGDERNFVGLRRSDAVEGTTWSSDLWAKPGETLTMRVYVNNAGGDVPDTDLPQEAIQGARVQMGLSKGTREFSVYGILSADNAKTVWDGATIHTDDGVDVIIDTATAKVETNAGTRDLSPAAFGPEGTLLGYREPDGIIKPRYEEDEYVSVRLRVVEAEATADEPAPPVASAAPASGYQGGWGPERTAYTLAEPASHTVLNSITDNPAQGDERNFVQIRPVAADNNSYTDIVRGEAGDEFIVFAYVANDAADNLAGSAASVHGLTAQLYLPSTGTDLPLALTFAGENAAAVWDGASVITRSPARVIYVPGSAVFHSAGAPEGSYRVQDKGFEEGKPMTLGYKKADGVMPVGVTGDGKLKGNGYLTFRIKITTP